VNWTLRKKLFRYYGRIALGLAVLGVIAFAFQTIVVKFGAYVIAGNWVALGRLLLFTVILVFLMILLLYLADKWYGNIISRMSGQKEPPME